ncbi:unnamed protein product [Ostreobium quekettii]|uniref:Sugar phosphate transporter domain-containing protein n=1 Tax=Ostreobium quekettii TaxID=121088 RepID=A0A8S1IZZ4_9CHLO|nr:unnamed protein product [Ostreobium quekettii]|eukprot:evm.model.scf_1832.1 EVM.evm.TU.scf_1832.1   scf_1832:24742-27799(-)
MLGQIGGALLTKPAQRQEKGDKDLCIESEHLLEGRSRAVTSGAWIRHLVLAIVSLTWMGISSGLILLNKYIMVTDGFKFPMALTAMGMAFSGLAGFLACRVFKAVAVQSPDAVSWNYYMMRIMPIGFFMAASFHFGNLVYMHLTVAFIQMLKSLTPVVTMAMLFAARLETPTKWMIYSVFVVAFGTALASYGEVGMSFFGVTAMLLSILFESSRLVLTQFVLVGLKFHPIEGLMYFAPACVLWLVIGIYFFELQAMLEADAFGLIVQSPIAYISASALGFAVNLLGYWVIVLSSSLTLKLLATVKSAALVLFCALFLGETVTPIEAIGYALSIVGFLWYTKVKTENDANRRQKEMEKSANAGLSTDQADEKAKG